MPEMISPIEAVDKAKACLNLTKPNEELSHEETASVLRTIWANMPGTIWIGKTAIVNPDWLPAIKLVAMVMFPNFK